jgi:hypothetical protein
MSQSRPSLASTVRLADDVLFQDLNGEAVLLNLKTGIYFGLDRVGTRVWQLLADHPTPAAVIGPLLDEFDVERERCEQDVLSLLTDLAAHGLVTMD